MLIARIAVTLSFLIAAVGSIVAVTGDAPVDRLFASDTHTRLSVSNLLTSDGRLILDGQTQGVLDLSGWNVTLDPHNGPVFSPQSTTWEYLGVRLLNNSVNTVAINGSDVYVGGQFTDAGGNPDTDCIARWDGARWHALGSRLSGIYSGSCSVNIIVVSGSNVYVGGRFTNAGGNPNANYIARWDGAQWHALGSGVNTAVSAIAVSGSNVYVGGRFTNAGGNPNADYIARWDGAQWHALGSGVSGWVNAIAVSDSNVYVGGRFTNAGGNPDADYIARWDGAQWHALGTGVNGWVNAIAVSGSDVYVGGGFTKAGA
ncbi:MAG: hypothetical protein ACUVS4_14120, partial [Chloroflexaceae bacterium]